MEELRARTNTHIFTSLSATASHLNFLQSNWACFASSFIQMKCSHILVSLSQKILNATFFSVIFSPKVLNTSWHWDLSDHIFWCLLLLLILFYWWFPFLILCHFILCSCVNSFTCWWYSNFLLQFFSFFSSANFFLQNKSLNLQKYSR